MSATFTFPPELIEAERVRAIYRAGHHAKFSAGPIPCCIHKDSCHLHSMTVKSVQELGKCDCGVQAEIDANAALATPDQPTDQEG